MRMQALALAILGAWCMTRAAEPIRLPVLTPPSLIDGELSEPSWSKAYRTGSFQNIKGGKTLEPAEGFLFRDQHALYVGIRCQILDYETTSKLLKTATQPFSGDNIEIFLDPGNTGNYSQIAVNVAGNLFFTGKQEPIQYGIQLHAHDWTFEARIPFRSLKLTDAVKEDKTWKINLARGNAAKNEFSSWSPVSGGSFHDHDNFKLLTGMNVNLLELKRLQDHQNRGNFDINLDRTLYDRQASLQAVLDLKYTKSMKGFSLYAELRNAHGKALHSKTVRPVFFQTKVDFAMEPLAYGRHLLYLELRDQQGKALMSGEKHFWKIPPATAKRSVRFTLKDQCLYRNGKFFFPIITWQCGATQFRKDRQTYLDDTEAIFKELKDYGFNTIVGFDRNFPEENYDNITKLGSMPLWESKLFLACKKAGLTFHDFARLAQKHDLHMIMSSSYLKNLAPQNIDLFIQQMLRIRDIDTIMLWTTADETDGQVMENLQKHRLYKELDPSRLTWLNVINAVAQNRDNAQVISTDPYPIPHGKITAVSVHADRLLHYVTGKDQSQWLWLQMFGGEGSWTRPPNAAEIRAMVYLALNHGIKGLAYFVWTPPQLRNGVRQDLNAWQSLKTLNQEITRLAPAFCLGKKLYSGLQSGIDITVLRHQGKTYVSMVNTSPKASGKLTLSIPGCQAKSFQFKGYETQMLIYP